MAKSLKCSECEVGDLSVFTTKCRSEMNNIQTGVFHKNEYIFKADNRDPGLFCMKSGKAILTKEGAEGRVVLNFIKPGEIAGLNSLIQNEKDQTSLIALEDVTGCFIQRTNFYSLLKSTDGEFALNVLSSLSASNQFMEKLLENAGSKRSIIKFCGLLLLIIEKYGLNTHNVLDVVLTKSEWADLSKIRRETLQRILKTLKEQNVLKWSDNRFVVLHFDRIRQISTYGKINGKKKNQSHTSSASEVNSLKK